MTLYDDIGVNEDASPEEIKKAYRDKAKENHPDKGGDKDRFQEIQHAYAVLSDPKKREYYDRTGQEQKNEPFQVKFSMFVNRYLINTLLSCNDTKHDDMKTGFLVMVNRCIREAKNQLEKLKNDNKDVLKIEDVVKRFRAKNGSDDILGRTLKGEADIRRQHHDQQKAHFEDELEFLEKTKEMINEYTYDFEKRPEGEKVNISEMLDKLRGRSTTIRF